MINLAVVVKLVDGTTYPETKLIPGDILAFERQFGIKLGADMKELDGELEWVLFLAWRPLHRRSIYPHDFEQFCDEADDIDIKRLGEPVPTLPVP